VSGIKPFLVSMVGIWWHMPVFPAFGKLRQEDHYAKSQPGLHSKFQVLEIRLRSPSARQKVLLLQKGVPLT
jgi:hypothetical protein